ncbi:CUE domain-containing protein [Podospora conica]|nr:CUE domain-containing protein [Schizothecium conicum]
MADEQVSPTTLLILAVLTGLLVRYVFFSKPGTATGTGQRLSPAQAAQAARLRELTAERVMQMFPHVDRRTALWELQRTGGNLAVTTERILAGRMETPPVTFQPPPPPAGTPGSSPVQGHGETKPAKGPSQPDLITRYKLQDKIAAAAAAGEAGESTGSAPTASTPGKKAWSANKEERQSLLQRRRDEMILEARRKMEAKMAAEKAKGATGRDS